MKYGIEIKVGNHWQPVHKVEAGPYLFDSKPVALNMARVLYPVQFREQMEGGPPSLRIVPIEQPA